MDLLLIGSRDHFQEIENILDNQFNLFNKDYNINKITEKIGDTNFLKYFSEDINSLEIRNKLNSNISDALTKIIVEIYQKTIVNKVVNNMCYYLSVDEKEEMKKNAFEMINEVEVTSNPLFEINENHRINNVIKNYLFENNEFIFEGFINFRLRFIIYKIESIVEKLLAQLLLEKEYNEFIKILQYFVEIQEPKINIINVVIKKDSRYLLYDESQNIINNDLLEEIVDEMSDSDMNNNDLLISSLITIAPKKIVLHIDQSWMNKDIIRIIKNVFVDRVEICSRCSFCIDKKEIKNKIEHK